MRNIGDWLIARLYWVLGALAGLLVINVLVYTFLVARLDQHTRNLQAVSDGNGQTLEELSRELETLTETVERIDRGKAVMHTLAENMLRTRKSRLVEVQEEMTRLMTKAGVSSDRIRYTYQSIPKNERQAWERRYLRTSFEVAVEGSYPQIKDFVRFLHNSPHFLVLEGISVTNSQKGATVLRASFAVSTYFVEPSPPPQGQAEGRVS